MEFDDNDDVLGDFLSHHGNVGAEATLADGTEIDGWRITGFIGRGGSSEVYCVQHRQTGLPAAMKILHRTEPRHIDRFAREVHFLEEFARPSTPANPSSSVGSRVPCDRHFPRFFAKGIHDDRPYVVMELLDPLPLPYGERDIARFLCAVAEEIEHLHIAGFVHRDIKPSNILWRLAGSSASRDCKRPAVPVIIDFGLLKKITFEPLRPNDDLSIVDGKAVGVGTPRYAAPEQFAGGEATPATDIHALGRLAYECFDGHPPAAWSRIIRRATSSIPGERYQTAGDFIRAVRRRHWMRNIMTSLFGVALTASLYVLWDFYGGREKVEWFMLGENVTTNIVREVFHHQTLTTNEFAMAGLEEKQRFVTPQRHYQSETNAIAARIINLNHATRSFTNPVSLNPNREYWIVGPGTLDVTLENSQGAVVRLVKCTLVNRTGRPLKEAGIRYILYKGAKLDFPEVARSVDHEREFLLMNTAAFPNDNTAVYAGLLFGKDFATVTYKKTIEDHLEEFRLEQVLRENRRKMMRDDRDTGLIRLNQ